VVEAVEAEGDDEEEITQKLYNESDYVLICNMSDYVLFCIMSDYVLFCIMSDYVLFSNMSNYVIICNMSKARREKEQRGERRKAGAGISSLFGLR
jgi:hypothetical protein